MGYNMPLHGLDKEEQPLRSSSLGEVFLSEEPTQALDEKRGKEEEEEEPTLKELPYPHQDGDYLVLGPQVFTNDQPGSGVINWKGVNYVPQTERATYDERYPRLGDEELARVDALKAAREQLAQKAVFGSGAVGGYELAYVAQYILSGEFEHGPEETDTADSDESQGGIWMTTVGQGVAWSQRSIALIASAVIALVALALSIVGVLSIAGVI